MISSEFRSLLMHRLGVPKCNYVSRNEKTLNLVEEVGTLFAVTGWR